MLQKLYKQNFTLLLTLTATKESADEEGIKQLNACLSRNLSNGLLKEFKELFFKKYPKDTKPSHKEFILLVVPKLIIKFGQNFNFDVSCIKSFTYKGETSKTQMASFVFDCEYVGLPNGYGGKPPATTLAERYPKRVTNILSEGYNDVNEILEKTPTLKSRCCEDLLSI